MKKALHRGSALNRADSRVQPIIEKQLPELHSGIKVFI